MTEDEKLVRLRRLQEAADAQWTTPRAIVLDGPGPFALPQCGNVSLGARGPNQTLVLQLETTESLQSVLIPIEQKDLLKIKNLIDALLVHRLSQTTQSETKN